MTNKNPDLPSMADVKDIAKYFIYRSQEVKRPITNLKLQKLVYYAQAWYLVFFDKELYNNTIEAWIHGPVVPSLYQEYKKFGFKEIKLPISNLSEINLPEDIKVHLNDVWDAYGIYDSKYLEMLTHCEEPWQEARLGLDADEPGNQEISTDTMKKYYTFRMNDAAKESSSSAS